MKEWIEISALIYLKISKLMCLFLCLKCVVLTELIVLKFILRTYDGNMFLVT